MSKGRTAGFRMGSDHRLKIKNSNILSYLIQHIEGKREMQQTQVTAAIALLRKVMPDLSQSDNTTTVRHDATDYSLSELVAIAKPTNGSAGSHRTANGAKEPDSVH